MLRKFFLLHIFVISHVLLQSVYAKDNKKSETIVSNKKVELKIKTKIPFDTEISREFASDIVGNSLSYLKDLAKNLKNHPLFFTCLAGGVLGYRLYKTDIAKIYNDVGESIEKNKGSYFLAGIGSLFILYLNKDYLLNKIPEVTDDCSDELFKPSAKPSSSDGKDPDVSVVEFSKSSARIYRPGEIKTTFNDVAGLETAKEELSDILMFLKDNESFLQIGAKIPKGVLLSGSPGNGKTLLARALAGEVRCPFLYVSGSEFIQAIVGVGAARVRSLFAVARDLAPCIVFIDEIDAIGRKRGGFGSGGDMELAQTLNQLLSEMDGFEQENSIVVIGATNRIDVLDPALMRPGRFDRKIEITLPFVNDRFKILYLHLQNIKSDFADNSLDIYKIAMGTPGYSGADLANLVNEAAILALRDSKKIVSVIHFDQAIDNINLGRESKGMEISQLEYRRTAIHEAGHALAIVYQEHCDPLQKISIVPRNGILGVTFSMSTKERYSHYIEEFRAEIVTLLGGSVAEEIIYGGRGAGAYSDLKRVRCLATQMVMMYGMTEEFKDITFENYINNEIHLPDELSSKLQEAVNDIIHKCRKIAVDIISKHKDKLEQLVDMLLEKGTVDGCDVYKLCDKENPKVKHSVSS